jgi:hypothetical protein
MDSESARDYGIIDDIVKKKPGRQD